MKKNFKSKSWEEKKEQIDQVVKQMDKEIEGHFTSAEQMREYLDFMSKFHSYSPRNTSLIKSQFSDAEAVGSFKFWKDKGFSVNKGEKGIQILVPNKTTPKFKDENCKWKNIKYATNIEKEKIKSGQLEKQKGRLYFSLGHVFDVSQTTAKASDLPDIFPNRWMEGEVYNYEVMMNSLEKIANKMDVSVGAPFGELGSAKGAFYHSVDAKNRGHIGLNPRNSELQNVKTMIHELAHAKLHSGEKNLQLSSEEKEFQAEMVAYSTTSYFGIDTSDYSLSYLANWTKGKELKDKEKLLSEVKMTSVEFIEIIEQDLLLEKEIEQEIMNYIINEYEVDESVALESIREERVSGMHPIAYTTLGDDDELEIQTIIDVRNNRIIKNVYGIATEEKEIDNYENKQDMLNYIKNMMFDDLVSLNKHDVGELIHKERKLSDDLGLTEEGKDAYNKSVIVIENQKLLERCN